MRILIFNHNGGSPYHGPNLRTYYAAKSLVEKGHKVSIISGTYSHKYVQLPPEDGAVTGQNIDGVDYYWVKVFHYRGLMSRIFSHFQFGFRILFHRCLLPSAADIVLFSGPPPEIFFFCNLFSKHIRAPICCDVRDLWPLTQIEMSRRYLLNPYCWLLYFSESYMFRVSQRVVSPLEGIFLYKEGDEFRKKVRFIPNCSEINEERSDASRVALRASFSCPELNINKGEEVDLKELKDRFFIVGYSGALDRDNDTESFVKAALAADDPGIVFVIVGDGVIKRALAEQVQKNANVLFIDRVPSYAVPQVLDGMHVVFCGLKAKSIYRYGVSLAKIYEYLASGKPVIWAVDAFNNPVSESGCGISVDPEDVGQICGAILKFKAMQPAVRLSLGESGRQYLKENYSSAVNGDKWERVLGDVVNEQ